MATIFCFTTTGNSLYAAKEIASGLDAKVISMSKKYTECEDDVIGFVFPVYFWGLPKTVERFIHQLNFKNKQAYVFAVFSYGGGAPGIAGVLDKALQARGVKLQYNQRIKNADNYIIKYKIKDQSEYQKNEADKIQLVVQDVKARKQNHTGNLGAISKQIYKLFPANDPACDRNFKVLDTCTGCTSCERICPANNIVMQDNKPSFKHQCEHCLACVHVCPVMAIQWKKEYKDNRSYHHPLVSKRELIEFVGTHNTTD